ncbi:MAG: pirin family protein [Robiginitomaculum sp.]|nr:pirin family protein [Robiginitomaculum sp.]
MSIEILNRDSLPLGGFAGLTEHRLVVDARIGGDSNTWDGLGNFVYLADARFLPKGETTMHGHKEIDVISVLVEGRIVHEGSLENGQSMGAGQAQAQRAGGEGFSHNEINPDNRRNRMIQLWASPETPGEPASYKFYDLEQGKTTRIYGGPKNQTETLDSRTIMEVAMLSTGQKVARKGGFLAYITKGTGDINGTDIKDGDLVRGLDLAFKSTNADTQIIIVTME